MTERMEVLPKFNDEDTTLVSYSSFNSDDDSVACVIYKMHPSDSSPPCGNDLTVDMKSFGGKPTIKLYNKRFFILILFCLYSASNAFQWLQYSIITRKIATFYQIDDLSVNLTSLIYMFVFVPGMIPASWLLNRFGLRVTVLIGSFGTFLGALVKCASLAPDKFWVTMVGQTLVAICNLFVLSLPPRIAAVWFGEREVSTATSIGVFGNQLGVCFGFFLPPLIVTAVTAQGIAYELTFVVYGTAAFTGLLFIAVLVFFEDKPEKPPSNSAAQATILQEDVNFMDSLRILITDLNMVMLTISYGINVGVFYAISTVLDQMIASAFPGYEAVAGNIGAIITVVGTVGSMVSGYILDKTHRYQETIQALYLFSFLGLIGFTLALTFNLSMVYIVSAFLGFFMTGYLPIGFEYAAEITYPQPEGNSAGILNASAQFFGIILIFISTLVVDRFGHLPCNLMLCSTLLVGLILAAFTRGSLKRREATMKTKEFS
ncbi:uncharacterized MFS-type transporter C09D4.1 [Tetranychus urticae]|uniref:Major facilitator superfamily (MFS) profile domain-containing protein n=1 Tax=Tetranychus urticae TaxID=32264 RepID=T1JVJ1_TETUR|nr:uncharacterized MFS-type transporter C09D4.1 [Tetranychus urticae]